MKMSLKTKQVCLRHEKLTYSRLSDEFMRTIKALSYDLSKKSQIIMRSTVKEKEKLRNIYNFCDILKWSL